MVCVQARAERAKEARWTALHASGEPRVRSNRTKQKGSPANKSARFRRFTDRIELNERNLTAQVSTSNVFRVIMEEAGNVVTSTMRNIPRFDGTKPKNYRKWSSKTCVVLSMSNKDVLDVKIEPVPIITDSDSPDAPTNLVEVQRWKRACETLVSIPLPRH